MVSSFSTVAKGLAMASLVSANIAELATRQTGQCSSLHIMAAGGCALPCEQDGLGLLAPTVSAISAAIPGSDLYLVPYNGAAAQAAVSTPLLVQAVEQYVAECPNTPIMLIGYSLGGIVVTNAVCNGIPYEKNIIASITYGEETFSFPQSYDRGTCRASAPLYARTNTAGCQKFAPVMQSYCNAADPKCCTGGTSNAEHFVYADQYTGDVVSFVSAQYQAFLPKTSATAPQVAVESSSSSTEMSSSTTSFPNAPYYPNATIPMTTAAGVAPGPQQQPTAFTQTTVYTSSGADSTVVITETIVVTRATTIPLYQPTGITTPIIITTGPAAQTFVPLSAVVESAAPPAATAAANTVVAFGPAGVSSAVVIAASSFVTPSPYQSVGPAGPVGTGAPVNGTGGLTPFNPGNGAGSLAIPSLISAVAMLALGMLL